VDADRRDSSADVGDLLAELDAVLLELRRRLDAYAVSGRDDIVAADEGFRVAGFVQASVESAARHAAGVATLLERAHATVPDR